MESRSKPAGWTLTSSPEIVLTPERGAGAGGNTTWAELDPRHAAIATATNRDAIPLEDRAEWSVQSRCRELCQQCVILVLEIVHVLHWGSNWDSACSPKIQHRAQLPLQIHCSAMKTRDVPLHGMRQACPRSPAHHMRSPLRVFQLHL